MILESSLTNHLIRAGQPMIGNVPLNELCEILHPDGLGIGAKLNKAINVEEASFMPVVKIDKMTGTKVDDDKKNKS